MHEVGRRATGKTLFLGQCRWALPVGESARPVPMGVVLALGGLGAVTLTLGFPPDQGPVGFLVTLALLEVGPRVSLTQGGWERRVVCSGRHSAWQVGTGGVGADGRMGGSRRV